MTESTRHQLGLWPTLSPVQKQLLELVYQVNQEVKDAEQKRWINNHSDNYSDPIEPFNWLLYGDVRTYQPSRLKLLCLRAGWNDEKAECTFRDLASHELVECLGALPYLGIRLTWQGQEAVCDELGTTDCEQKEEKAIVVGVLSELGWRALAIATQHQEKEIPRDLVIAPDSHCAEISLNVWKLLAHREPPLVSIRHGLVHTTPFGYVFYAEHYAYYHKRYPAVAAPVPQSSRADIESKLWRTGDLPSLARLKRGRKGLRETAASIGNGITPSFLYQFERGNIFNKQKIAVVQAWLEG